jgi:ubiquinone/menaquinone biosynthesis C-methylase UbiE
LPPRKGEIMNNGTSEKVIEHFNRVAKLPDFWDHNQQYQKFMLKHITTQCQLGLDIGCGTGEMSNKLSYKCDEVIGIDVAPVMISEAKHRNQKVNIKYIIANAEDYLDNEEASIDVIVSIAAIHHMDYESILRKCKKALKKNGVLIIQDLYTEDTMKFKLLSLIGILTNPLFMLIKTGKLKVSKEQQEVWKNHGEDDHYNTLKEIKKIADRCLPHYKIKRHMFWRYTLIYYK